MAVKIGASATRMELLRLRRRLVLAEKGHRLLKDKQDELVRRFFALLDEYLLARDRLHRALASLAAASRRARVDASTAEIRAAAWPPRAGTRLRVSSDAILNLRVPSYRLELPPWRPSFGPRSLSASYDRLAAGWQEAAPLLVDVASREKALRLLTAEIETTRRRVNALEHNLIPGLEGGIREITIALAEQERSSLTRLLRVKEVVRGH